jgi:hypothetical protein
MLPRVVGCGIVVEEESGSALCGAAIMGFTEVRFWCSGLWGFGGRGSGLGTVAIEESGSALCGAALIGFTEVRFWCSGLWGVGLPGCGGGAGERQRLMQRCHYGLHVIAVLVPRVVGLLGCGVVGVEKSGRPMWRCHGLCGGTAT